MKNLNKYIIEKLDINKVNIKDSEPGYISSILDILTKEGYQFIGNKSSYNEIKTFGNVLYTVLSSNKLSKKDIDDIYTKSIEPIYSEFLNHVNDSKEDDYINDNPHYIHEQEFLNDWDGDDVTIDFLMACASKDAKEMNKTNSELWKLFKDAKDIISGCGLRTSYREMFNEFMELLKKIYIK